MSLFPNELLILFANLGHTVDGQSCAGIDHGGPCLQGPLTKVDIIDHGGPGLQGPLTRVDIINYCQTAQLDSQNGLF